MILWAILFWLAFNPRIERGYTLDTNGNGISVDAKGNPVDEVYNYVQYAESESGTEIVSLFLYDPRYIGRHEDDSIFRKDFILSKGNDVSKYEPYTDRLYWAKADVILDDGNVFSANVLMDNKGTATPTDDTFESIW